MHPEEVEKLIARSSSLEARREREGNWDNIALTLPELTEKQFTRLQASLAYAGIKTRTHDGDRPQDTAASRSVACYRRRYEFTYLMVEIPQEDAAHG